MKTETSKTFKCPSCDAALSYGGRGNMTCAYCGAEIDAAFFAEDGDIKGEGKSSWDKYGSHSEAWKADDSATLFTCTSCGGEIICESDTAATVCPYCDNPALITSRLDGFFKPDVVLPFSVEKKDAAEILERFTRKKPLLPSSFRKLNKIESLRGVYVPFWLYDCDTLSRYIYSATIRRSWTSGNYRYTKTSYFKLYRRGGMSFSDIPVDASVAMDNTMLESIEPFDFGKTVPFSDAYLAGFFANRYDDSAESCATRAKERVDRSVSDAMRRTVHGYSTVSVHTAETVLTRNDIRYALLPVWFMTSRYKGKAYSFAINGQTGKMSGKLPISRLRFAALLLGITAVLGTLFSLISMLL